MHELLRLHVEDGVFQLFERVSHFGLTGSTRFELPSDALAYPFIGGCAREGRVL